MEHLLKTRKGRLKFGTYHVQLESGRFAQWFAIFVNPNSDGSPDTSWSPNALYSPTFSAYIDVERINVHFHKCTDPIFVPPLISLRLLAR